MGYIYMMNQHIAASQIDTGILPETDAAAIKPIVLTTQGRESVFRIMRRIYRLLDEWKASRPDTPILLSADPETAKIVNSYFYEMSDSEYKRFSIQDGEVRRYQI